MKRYLSEVVGTCFLTLAIALGQQPLAVGAMLIALMYMCHRGMYNPALAVGAVMTGFLDKDRCLGVIIAQIVGACVGLCFIWLLVGVVYTYQPTFMGWRLILNESLMVFLFTVVYLVMREKHRDDNDHVFGLAIGFTFMAIWFFGGLYNPAVLVASFIGSVVRGNFSTDMLMATGACLIGPFIGAVLAAWGYDRFHRKEML